MFEHSQSPIRGQLAMMWEKKSLTDSKYLFKIPNHRLAQCLSGSVGLYWFRSKCGWRLYLVSDSRLTPTATTGAHDAQHHPHKQHNHMQQHIPAIQPRRASQPRPRGKHIAQPHHPLFTVNQSAPSLATLLCTLLVWSSRWSSRAANAITQGTTCNHAIQKLVL